MGPASGRPFLPNIGISMTRSRKMIARTVALAALVGAAGTAVVSLSTPSSSAAPTRYCSRRASSRRRESRSIRTTRKNSKNTITATTFPSWRIACEKSLA